MWTRLWACPIDWQPILLALLPTLLFGVVAWPVRRGRVADVKVWVDPALPPDVQTAEREADAAWNRITVAKGHGLRFVEVPTPAAAQAATRSSEIPDCSGVPGPGEIR